MTRIRPPEFSPARQLPLSREARSRERGPGGEGAARNRDLWLASASTGLVRVSYPEKTPTGVEVQE